MTVLYNVSIACLDLSVCILNLLPLPEVEVGEDALLAVDDGREEHDLHDDARSLGCNSIDLKSFRCKSGTSPGKDGALQV